MHPCSPWLCPLKDSPQGSVTTCQCIFLSPSAAPPGGGEGSPCPSDLVQQALSAALEQSRNPALQNSAAPGPSHFLDSPVPGTQ